MPIDLCCVIKRSDLSLGRIKPPTSIKLTDDEADWLLWDIIRDMLGKGELPKEKKPNLGGLHPKKMEEIEERHKYILAYLEEHPSAGPAQIMRELRICMSHWKLFKKTHPNKYVNQKDRNFFDQRDNIIIEFLQRNPGSSRQEIIEGCGMKVKVWETFREKFKMHNRLRVENGRWFIDHREENSGNELSA